MRELRVVWTETPSEVRNPLETLLEEWGFLIPPWVQSLGVRYFATRLENGEANFHATAAMDAEPEYRQARLLIYGEWLVQSAADRERDIVHEMLHLALAPMVLEHQDVIERLFEDGSAPKFQAYMEEQWRQVYEGAVQDLRNALIHVGDVLPTRLRSEDGAPG